MKQPVCEANWLWLHLGRLLQVVDHGLSALCEAQLGLPLDKQLQCSAWGKRPLSKDQLRYAAADAACLLALLASFVSAIGRPQDWPLAHDDDAAASSKGSSGQQQQSVRSSSPAAPAPAEAEGEEEEATEQERVLAAAAANNAQAGAPRLDPQQSSHPQQPAAEGMLPELLAGCSLQQLRAAAAAWGTRLEINGTGAAKRCGKRGGNARRQQRQGAAGGGGGRLPAGCSGFPLHVPWLEAAGGEVRRCESGSGLCCLTHSFLCFLSQQQQELLRCLLSPHGRTARCDAPCHTSSQQHRQPPHLLLPPLPRPRPGTQLQGPAAARFLVDTMADGLAKQLRLCGFDAGEARRQARRQARRAAQRRPACSLAWNCARLYQRLYHLPRRHRYSRVCARCPLVVLLACRVAACRVAASNAGEGAASHHLQARWRADDASWGGLLVPASLPPPSCAAAHPSTACAGLALVLCAEPRALCGACIRRLPQHLAVAAVWDARNSMARMAPHITVQQGY